MIEGFSLFYFDNKGQYRDHLPNWSGDSCANNQNYNYSNNQYTTIDYYSFGESIEDYYYTSNRFDRFSILETYL